MKRIQALCLLVLSGLMVPGAASADEERRNAEEKRAYQLRMFELCDFDENGRVTTREYVLTVFYNVFEEYDLDGDGKLTREEFMSSVRGKEKQTAPEEWEMMDADGDGVITFKESLKNQIAIDELVAEFKEIDKKNRGYVTLDDLPDPTETSDQD